MISVMKQNEPVFIQIADLKNGWEHNGHCFYIIIGKFLYLHLTLRKGTIGTVGTEILKIPYNVYQSWAYNMQGNGAVVIQEDGRVKILVEVPDPKNCNLNVDIVTILK